MSDSGQDDRVGRPRPVEGLENALEIEAGERVRLVDGSIVTVVHNPLDGMWLFCDYVEAADPSLAGTSDQPVYVKDVLERF